MASGEGEKKANNMLPCSRTTVNQLQSDARTTEANNTNKLLNSTLELTFSHLFPSHIQSTEGRRGCSRSPQKKIHMSNNS